MSVFWTTFKRTSMDGEREVHVVPINECDEVVAGHVLVMHCPCKPEFELSERATLVNHHHPTKN